MDKTILKQRNKVDPTIIEIVLCIGLYIAVLFSYVYYYDVPKVITINPAINIWDEIVDFSSVLPFLCPIIAVLIIKKIDPEYPTVFRYIWLVLFAILICCYRVAYILDLSIVYLSVIGLGQFVVCVILALVLDKKHKKCLFISKDLLGDAFGKSIKNTNILCVQLFECEKSFQNNGLVSFQIQSKGTVINNNSDDVNSILKIHLEFPAEDYNQFRLTMEAYNTLVTNGADDEGRKLFRDGIQKKKTDLVNRLNAVPLDKISKSDSCLARLLVCYNVLEKMVDEPLQVSVDFEDGELGLETDHEKRLFSMLRTGMLGAILFESDRRYYFRYRRDGIKNGRKYCAFVLNPDDLNGIENQNCLIICLVIIRENETKKITGDIQDWISSAEKKISKTYRKNSKEAA